MSNGPQHPGDFEDEDGLADERVETDRFRFKDDGRTELAFQDNFVRREDEADEFEFKDDGSVTADLAEEAASAHRGDTDIYDPDPSLVDAPAPSFVEGAENVRDEFDFVDKGDSADDLAFADDYVHRNESDEFDVIAHKPGGSGALEEFADTTDQAETAATSPRRGPAPSAPQGRPQQSFPFPNAPVPPPNARPPREVNEGLALPGQVQEGAPPPRPQRATGRMTPPGGRPRGVPPGPPQGGPAQGGPPARRPSGRTMRHGPPPGPRRPGPGPGPRGPAPNAAPRPDTGRLDPRVGPAAPRRMAPRATRNFARPGTGPMPSPAPSGAGRPPGPPPAPPQSREAPVPGRPPVKRQTRRIAHRPVAGDGEGAVFTPRPVERPRGAAEDDDPPFPT